MQIAVLWSVEAKSKYYDGEIRPYEFGFNQENFQHRHESKGNPQVDHAEWDELTGFFFSKQTQMA